MKSISIVILSFYFSASLGQISKITNTKAAIDFFNQGVTMLNKNEFRKADSLFTKSLLLQPNKDALFNRAISRLILKDTCSACTDLLSGIGLYSDRIASDLYTKLCVLKKDTIFFDANHLKLKDKIGSDYYEENITSKCNSIIHGIVHKNNHTSSIKLNLNYLNDDNRIDTYATYVIIDSIKYYDFIFSSSFENDNLDKIRAFTDRLTKKIDSKYKFDSIPHIRRYCSVKLLIDNKGLVSNCEFNSNPFESFENTTRANIEDYIYTLIKQMPQLKPDKLFGDFVNRRYTIYFGI